MLLITDPALRARCGGSSFCYGSCRTEVRQPPVWLPQERDATLSKSTSVRSDRHQVRRRYVAEAEREHALCEWDDRSHHALPLETGGGINDVQGASERDARRKVTNVHDQAAL